VDELARFVTAVECDTDEFNLDSGGRYQFYVCESRGLESMDTTDARPRASEAP